MRCATLLALFATLQWIASAALLSGYSQDDPWLEAGPSIEPASERLQWLASPPPSSDYYRWHDDLMRRSRRMNGGGVRYTAAELVEMLRRLAASGKLRQVRVSNKGIRFGISKRLF